MKSFFILQHIYVEWALQIYIFKVEKGTHLSFFFTCLYLHQTLHSLTLVWAARYKFIKKPLIS